MRIHDGDAVRNVLVSTAAILMLAGVLVVTMVVGRAPAAYAAQPAVGLGTAESFAVLAGSTVTNTGPSMVSGDLGVSPGTAVTGFPPGQVNSGVIHAGDPVAQQAQQDLTTAYNDAAGRSPRVDKTGDDLGGETLVPGVYNASTEMSLTGTVTLDAKGDSSAVFVFQAGSTLTTASGSRVALQGGAQACNVFWQVGSSATIGTTTTFVGTVMALADITVQTNATIEGRVLARTGQVSLDTNTITKPTCAGPSDLVCDNTQANPYTGTYQDVTVPQGASCYLRGALILGDLKALGGAIDVFVINTEVQGGIDIRGAEGTVKIGPAGCRFDPRVGGIVRVTLSHNVLICFTSADNNITVTRNDGRITLRDNVAGNNIMVTDNLAYNRQPGDGTHRNIEAIRLRDNVAGGHITVRRNAGRPLILRNNTPRPLT